MSDDEWVVPRCGHGNILLGCPEKECPEQDAEIAANQAMLDAYYERQQREAREFIMSIVRPASAATEAPL